LLPVWVLARVAPSTPNSLLAVGGGSRNLSSNLLLGYTLPHLGFRVLAVACGVASWSRFSFASAARGPCGYSLLWLCGYSLARAVVLFVLTLTMPGFAFGV
jgi:hypothetical protein